MSDSGAIILQLGNWLIYLYFYASIKSSRKTLWKLASVRISFSYIFLPLGSLCNIQNQLSGYPWSGWKAQDRDERRRKSQCQCYFQKILIGKWWFPCHSKIENIWHNVETNITKQMFWQKVFRKISKMWNVPYTLKDLKVMSKCLNIWMDLSQKFTWYHLCKIKTILFFKQIWTAFNLQLQYQNIMSGVLFDIFRSVIYVP